MKKFRGQKKYFKRLATENDLDNIVWLDFDEPKIWLDNWHLHFDWKGLGDNSFKKRRPHLDKLIRHFGIIERETKKLNKDFQLYAVLFDDYSFKDALYVNTPNPNNNFPFKFVDLNSQSNLKNHDLEKYVNGLEGFEKRYGVSDENFCILFKRGIGVEPL